MRSIVIFAILVALFTTLLVAVNERRLGRGTGIHGWPTGAVRGR